MSSQHISHISIQCIWALGVYAIYINHYNYQNYYQVKVTLYAFSIRYTVPGAPWHHWTSLSVWFSREEWKLPDENCWVIRNSMLLSISWRFDWTAGHDLAWLNKKNVQFTIGVISIRQFDTILDKTTSMVHSEIFPLVLWLLF